MNLIDQLGRIWDQILGFLSLLVIPDWGSLVGLLPILLVIGVLGPLFSLIALIWVIYMVRKPRARLKILEGPYPAQLDALGQPVYPTGQPYCARDGLIYPSRSTVCDVCRDELVVTCPKCTIGRQARIRTCANCGLVLQIDERAVQRAVVPVGPPPGGAAAA